MCIKTTDTLQSKETNKVFIINTSRLSISPNTCLPDLKTGVLPLEETKSPLSQLLAAFSPLHFHQSELQAVTKLWLYIGEMGAVQWQRDRLTVSTAVSCVLLCTWMSHLHSNKAVQLNYFKTTAESYQELIRSFNYFVLFSHKLTKSRNANTRFCFYLFQATELNGYKALFKSYYIGPRYCFFSNCMWYSKSHFKYENEWKCWFLLKKKKRKKY